MDNIGNGVVCKKRVEAMTIGSEFPSRLRMLREREGKSRLVLSQLCGLPDSSIRRYERGEAKPTMDSLVAIADHFCVSIDYLVGRTNY